MKVFDCIRKLEAEVQSLVEENEQLKKILHEIRQLTSPDATSLVCYDQPEREPISIPRRILETSSPPMDEIALCLTYRLNLVGAYYSKGIVARFGRIILTRQPLNKNDANAIELLILQNKDWDSFPNPKQKL